MGAKHFLRGATFGALIASLVAIFFAPQGGKKTRKEVMKIIYSLSKRLSVQAGDMKRISKTAYDDLVTQTVSDYAKGKDVASTYYKDIAHILKKHWKEISQILNKK